MSSKNTKFQDGRIVRSEEALNPEMPFEQRDGFITPTKSLHVRTEYFTQKDLGASSTSVLQRRVE